MILSLANQDIATPLPAFVMGIINLTPDSFWSGSRKYGQTPQAAVGAMLKMEEDGADIIDTGAESSRPGAAYVGAEEETRRLIPVIAEFRRHSSLPLSVDTRKLAVFRAAVDAGADILNDISALEDDPDLGAYAARGKIPVILMHKRGEPAIMQQRTEYDDPVAEVEAYLWGRIDYALSCGIGKDKIILDPGIGFGKNQEANRALIARSGGLCGGEYPVLMALSRKTWVGGVTGRDVPERLAGTLAANLIAVQNGAALVRAHDVRETVDMLKILKELGTHNEHL
ncbi:MAG: dihydropteroate synthase [Treponema sp.]|jgi:dihydropteroate synthase|nr:dihydropteroate synthase [Treponema sp.]